MDGLGLNPTDTLAALRAPPEWLSRDAWEMDPPMPHERPHVMREEAAYRIDRLLTRVARSQGALEIAIGETLAALAVGDRTLRLRYSGIADYARERLGIAGRTAQAMMRLARELRDRPLLRDAVRRGVVSARKAHAVLPVARGEAEAAWVERARAETVRALEAAVRSAGSAPQEDEEWERVHVNLSPESRARLDEALALAGKMLGAGAPKWQRLEAICDEYLGAHPVEVSEDERSGLHGPVADWVEAAKEALEAETERWVALEAIEPVEAPDTGDEIPFAPSVAPPQGGAKSRGEAADSSEVPRLDAQLRELAGMRDRWDELVGHLGLLIQTCGLWRTMGFASFGHYCAERLGMGGRAVEQRIALERRLYELPPLRRALREGRVSYEKAKLVARCADESSVETWISRAERSTCIALQRELDAAEETQMCARNELSLRVPARVASRLDAACRAAREAAGRWLRPEECLVRVADHFIATWKEALKERATPHRRVLARDRGWCQVPGCSRPATQAHHVVYRSHGGSDDESNLTSLCAAHHLHGVHKGWIRVTGRAPHALTWEMGAAAGAPRLGREGSVH
jgi:hypothetical protein